jgi:hypothetical protein
MLRAGERFAEPRTSRAATPFTAITLAARLWLLLWLGAVALPAQNGTTEGRELEPVSDLESGVESLVAGLFGDDENRIGKVTVLDETAGRLTLRVEYSGLAGGRLLAQALDRDGRAQREVRSGSVTLPDTGDSVDVVLELEPEVAEGATLLSHRLRIRGRGKSALGPAITRLYRVDKEWSVAPSPEHVVVRVTARPVGAAQGLGDRPEGKRLPPLRKLKVIARPGGTPQLGTQVTTRVSSPLESRSAPTTPQSSTPAPSQLPQKLTAARPAALTEKGSTATSRLGRVRLDRFRFGLDEEEKDLGAKGPGPSALELVSEVRVDVSLERDEISSLFPLVYQDQNPSSGVFYYLPSAYNLAWDESEGYEMRVLFNAAKPGEAAGDVTIAMALDAGVAVDDVEVARVLLHAAAARHPGLLVKELRSLPIEAAPEVSLRSGLQQLYEIPPEQVAVEALSDSLGEVALAIRTDPVTVENLQLALEEDVGLSGTLTFEPYGKAIAPQEIPIRVQLASVGTFGKFTWHRDGSWHNPAPYPLQLRYLHALLIEDGVPVVYSWELGNAAVPPLARVEIDANSVPRWLEERAHRIWLDYLVDRSCDACDEQVLAAITGGVASLSSSQITFRTLSPLADTGAYQVTLKVRSRFFHPQKRELVEKAIVVIEEDDQTYTVGPIYTQSGESGPLYEYQLQVLMPDGRMHRSEGWLASDELYQPIGSFQIEEALGELP